MEDMLKNKRQISLHIELVHFLVTSNAVALSEL